MSYLAWEDWGRANNWEPRMNAAYWLTESFSEILFGAMRRLNRDLSSGRLLSEINALTATNSPVGFSHVDVDRIFRNGMFKYRQWRHEGGTFPTITPMLSIHGPSSSTRPNVNGYVTEIPDWSIHINFPAILAWGANNPNVVPLDLKGKACLEVYVGKTVIHEVMHNHGFRHPGRPAGAYNPAHQYYRTLPEVAEHAFYNIYRNDLFGGLANALPLTGGGYGDGDIAGMRCGTSARAFAPTTSEHSEHAGFLDAKGDEFEERITKLEELVEVILGESHNKKESVSASDSDYMEIE